MLALPVAREGRYNEESHKVCVNACEIRGVEGTIARIHACSGKVD